jgi:hypothetical protein
VRNLPNLRGELSCGGSNSILSGVVLPCRTRVEENHNYVDSFFDGVRSVKTFLKLGALVLFCMAQTGCGEPSYDVEEIDADEAAAEEEKIGKQMEEEMNQGMNPDE